MPLSSGTRLGIREMIAPLAAGGSAEDCPARDPRFDRERAVPIGEGHRRSRGRAEGGAPSASASVLA
jgi:hypothetical protein